MIEQSLAGGGLRAHRTPLRPRRREGTADARRPAPRVADGQAVFLPGELNTPERFAQRVRLISTRYWHAVGGLSYSAGSVDVFVSITKYVWGRDAHNGQAYTVGSTWYFDLLQ